MASKRNRQSENRIQKIDRSVRNWMRKHGFAILRLSIGFIFLWFGLLKFFPGLSPAEELVTDTIHRVTFGLFSALQINMGLAVWETLIGLGLVLGKFMRFTLLLLFLQLPGTFLPVFLFPEQVFEWIPFVPTLKGQYIFKNVVLIAAGILLGGHVGNKPSDGIKPKANAK